MNKAHVTNKLYNESCKIDRNNFGDDTISRHFYTNNIWAAPRFLLISPRLSEWETMNKFYFKNLHFPISPTLFTIQQSTLIHIFHFLHFKTITVFKHVQNLCCNMIIMLNSVATNKVLLLLKLINELNSASFICLFSFPQMLLCEC